MLILQFKDAKYRAIFWQNEAKKLQQIQMASVPGKGPQFQSATTCGGLAALGRYKRSPTPGAGALRTSFEIGGTSAEGNFVGTNPIQLTDLKVP